MKTPVRSGSPAWKACQYRSSLTPACLIFLAKEVTVPNESMRAAGNRPTSLIDAHVNAFNTHDDNAFYEVFSDNAVIVDGIAPFLLAKPKWSTEVKEMLIARADVLVFMPAWSRQRRKNARRGATGADCLRTQPTSRQRMILKVLTWN